MWNVSSVLACVSLGKHLNIKDVVLNVSLSLHIILLPMQLYVNYLLGFEAQIWAIINRSKIVQEIKIIFKYRDFLKVFRIVFCK